MNTNAMQLFCDEHFSKNEIMTLIDKIASNLVQLYFIDNIITNSQYEKDIFKIIQKNIMKELNNIFENNLDLSKELSIYLFKIYFKTIFQSISELLLKELALSNDKVINFLKYYSLNTIVIDAKKYKVPQIKSNNGLIWNITSIISVLKNYMKAKESIKTVELEIQNLDKERKKFFINNLSPIEYNKKVDSNFNTLEQEITKNEKRINILRDSLKIEKNAQEIQTLQKELSVLQEKRIFLRENKDALLKTKIKQINLEHYNVLMKQIESLKKNIQADYKVIEKNSDTYKSIQDSLINALISKKQALK